MREWLAACMYSNCIIEFETGLLVTQVLQRCQTVSFSSTGCFVRSPLQSRRWWLDSVGEPGLNFKCSVENFTGDRACNLYSVYGSSIRFKCP